VERILIGMLTNGHILLEGVPGLAKTLTCKTLACINIGFQRISSRLTCCRGYRWHLGLQPVDEPVRRQKGPIHTNLVLADEINRAPPGSVSLLEAMQEHQVTISDTTFPLPKPFWFTTQNPISRGTYPCPKPRSIASCSRCR
jgi:MoxR-like ATPase